MKAKLSKALLAPAVYYIRWERNSRIHSHVRKSWETSVEQALLFVQGRVGIDIGSIFVQVVLVVQHRL